LLWVFAHRNPTCVYIVALAVQCAYGAGLRTGLRTAWAGAFRGVLSEITKVKFQCAAIRHQQACFGLYQHANGALPRAITRQSPSQKSGRVCAKGEIRFRSGFLGQLADNTVRPTIHWIWPPILPFRAGAENGPIARFMGPQQNNATGVSG
jgi:hypothetical protein